MSGIVVNCEDLANNTTEEKRTNLGLIDVSPYKLCAYGTKNRIHIKDIHLCAHCRKRCSGPGDGKQISSAVSWSLKWNTKNNCCRKHDWHVDLEHWTLNRCLYCLPLACATRRYCNNPPYSLRSSKSLLPVPHLTAYRYLVGSACVKTLKVATRLNTALC